MEGSEKDTFRKRKRETRNREEGGVKLRREGLENREVAAERKAN